jgi:hypothetical protein
MAPKMPIMLVASLDAGELSGHPHGARTSTTPTHGEQNVPYREAADDVVGHGHAGRAFDGVVVSMNARTDAVGRRRGSRAGRTLSRRRRSLTRLAGEILSASVLNSSVLTHLL